MAKENKEQLSLDGELAGLKNSLKQLKNEVENPLKKRVDTLFVEDEKAEREKNKKDVFQLEQKIEEVESNVSEKKIESSEKKINTSDEKRVLLKKEQKYAQYFSQVNDRVQTSDRLAKQEIASSAKDLLTDLITEDPNPIANSIRKVANWFLS
jgi:hypothetical protein